MTARRTSRVRWTVTALGTGAALALLAAAERVEAADVAFESARSYDVGILGPLVPADLNGDGRLDFAVFGDGLGVLLGRRPDGFEPARTFAATLSLEPGVIADFDHDGFLDVAGVSDRRVSVLRGDGAGGFGPESLFGDSRRYTDIASGDFDEDGNVDLAVSASSGDAIAILLGNGAGGFGAATTYATPTVATGRGLVVADFTSDGRVDVALSGATLATHLFPGDGLGGLEPAIESAAPHFAIGIDAIDANEDGNLDLLVIGRTDPSADDFVGLLLGDGAGQFSDAGFLDATRRARSATTGDFDRDGHADVAVARDARFVSILLGDGTGAFAIAGHLATGGILAIRAGDIDEDGDADLAYQHGDRVGILKGDGSGGFAAAREFAGEGPSGSGHLALGRFDADAHVDAALLSGRSVVSFSGEGSGGFVRRHTASLDKPAYAITAGDLDGDGDTDAVASHLSGDDDLITVLLCDGDGRFATIPIPIQAPFDVAIADFDGEGTQDLVVVNGILGPDPDFGGVSFLKGLGAGAFAAPITSPVGSQPRKVRAGDFDHDGVPDLAVGKGTGESQVVFLRGEGDGRFAPARGLPSGLGVTSLRLADFDGDSELDVAWGDGRPGQPSTLRIQRGDGAFGFSPLAFIAIESFAADLLADDFDDDGDLDLALANPFVAEVALFEGIGAGLLQPVSGGLPVISGTHSLASADFDEDGYPDLAAATSTDSSFWTYLNRTFDPIRTRAGNVNTAVGPLASPLRVNSSIGDGVERLVVLERDAPFEIAMEALPSRPAGPSKYALYGWLGEEPSAATVRRLPDGIGFSTLPMPLSGASVPAPVVIWNNIGRRSRLGDPTLPSSPAPSVVLDRPRGLRRPAVLFLQGLVLDAGAPGGRAAVTNGIEVRVP